jgi:hypothetical protein
MASATIVATAGQLLAQQALEQSFVITNAAVARFKVKQMFFRANNSTLVNVFGHKNNKKRKDCSSDRKQTLFSKTFLCSHQRMHAYIGASRN